MFDYNNLLVNFLAWAAGVRECVAFPKKALLLNSLTYLDPVFKCQASRSHLAQDLLRCILLEKLSLTASLIENLKGWNYGSIVQEFGFDDP
jgi:hypothetical protein